MTEPVWDSEKGVWAGERAAGTGAIPSPLWIFGYGSLCWKTEFPFVERFDAVLPGWSRLFLQRSMDHRGTPELPGRVVTLVRPGVDIDMGEEREAVVGGAGEAAPLGAALRAHSGGVNGVVYRVADEDAAAVLENLDFREKGGYTRATARVTEVRLGGGVGGGGTPAAAVADAAAGAAAGAEGGSAAAAAPRTVEALVYTGTTENPNYAGKDEASASLAGIAAIIGTAVGPSGPNREYLFLLCDYLRTVGAEDAHAFQLEALVKAAQQEDEGAGATAAN